MADCQTRESRSFQDGVCVRQGYRALPILGLLVSTLALVLLLSACGNVGEPLPPLIQIPAAISDLSVLQVGKSIKLSWTLPKFNTDGSAATTISRINIFRSASVSSGLAEANFNRMSVPWKTFGVEELSGFAKGNQLMLMDDLDGLSSYTLFRMRVFYAVQVLNRKKQNAGLSNIVSVELLPAAIPPLNLRLDSMGEHEIEISWDAPVLGIDGAPLAFPLAFNVYRSLSPQGHPGQKMNSEPLRETHFRDQSITLDVTYYYFVRAELQTTSKVVESGESAILQVTNKDIYPPKTPAEVVAVGSDQAVSLVWLPNEETDLAGYWVYRSGPDKRFERINDQLLQTASTIDKSVEKGQTYFYRVQSVDLKGNASKPSEEVSETVR